MRDYTCSGALEAAQDGPVSWTAHADLAAAAARILVNEGRFDGPTPPLTAPQALSLADVASILSEGNNRQIERRTITDEEQAGRLAAKGFPPKAVALSLGIYRAARAGEFAATSPLLTELIGREPVTLREVLAQRRDG